jgi:HPt (histidine-containing phosphotransfer) domain-containing protein
VAEAINRAALDELVEVTGGDRAFLAELIDTFLTDAVGMMAEMDAAVDAGDDAAIVRPAHSLKSNALSFGATRLAELSRAVEADARQGGVPDAADRVDAIRAELVEVERALRVERDAGP